MNTVQKTIAISIEPRGIEPTVHVNQYDAGSRTLLFDFGPSYSIPAGASVSIRGTKPDKTGFAYPCTIASGKASVVVQDQMTVCAGRVPCEVRIEVDGTRIHSATFVLDVKPSALADDIKISETELPIVEGAQRAALDAEESKNSALNSQNAASASATSAANSASAAAESADKAAKIAAGITPGSGASTAATITIGTVTTGDAGTSASVTNSGTASAAVFDFVIPKGDKGDKGDTGDKGADGKTPAITATASVDDTTGTPAVKVTKSGTEVAPNFDFAFSGVKGTGGSSQVYETVAVTTTGWENVTVNGTTYKKWSALLANAYEPNLATCRLYPSGVVPTEDELNAYGLLVSSTIDGTTLNLYGTVAPSATYTIQISGVIK